MKNIFDIVGETTDGKLVIKGILKFEETYGLPLEDILEYMKENDFVPSWYHLIDEAKIQKVNMNKFLTKLETCIVTVYGKSYYKLIWKDIENYSILSH